MGTISLARALELFEYNRRTGVLRWRANCVRKNKMRGKEAGHPWKSRSGKSYRQVMVDGCTLYVHRVIVLLETGIEPAEVDHRDGNGLNNKWNNLRACSKQENARNIKRHSNSTSPFKGITFDKERGLWAARIRPKKGHTKHLGRFKTATAAAQAYRAAALKYHGKFARLA
jgi:hypothetical protein